VLLLFLALGCASHAPTPLYDRLGGRAGIERVVDEFVAIVVADPRIGARFAKTDLVRFRNVFVEQLGALTGGPELYRGPNMIEVHKGMQISEDEWTAALEDLGKAMQRSRVGRADQEAVIVALFPMKWDIIGH
jgi:hemoglobin